MGMVSDMWHVSVTCHMSRFLLTFDPIELQKSVLHVNWSEFHEESNGNGHIFQSRQGLSLPEAVYSRSAPKLVPTRSSGQLWRHHQSYGSCYCQSKIVIEASDVTKAKEDEKSLPTLPPVRPMATTMAMSSLPRTMKSRYGSLILIPSYILWYLWF